MKSEKGITLSSLIIYVIAMVIVVSTIAVITKYFYGNVNKLSNSTTSLGEITKLNTFITEQVNKSQNEIAYCSEDGSIIVFYCPNDKDEENNINGYTQFTFKNSSIYLNKIKICNGIDNCKFENLSDENIYRFKINLTVDGNERQTTYTLKNAK